MIQSLKVILWGEEVGKLAWDNKRKISYFEYNPNFLKKGLNISPLIAPIDGLRGRMPIWGEEAKIYQKLPSFLSDSLPDAWGNQLFELWRQQNRLSNSEITPLDKLSFIGKRGMGALEFFPEVSRGEKVGKVDVGSLANLAEYIFEKRENARIKPEESITMQSLLTVGTSAGGRQPKAILAVDRQTGEIRSGQISGLENYDYYLIKFGNSQYSSAELEMAYYELAIKAGINMMHSELYEVGGNKHFMTQRFDRKDGKKIHTQTLAAIKPDAESYEDLLTVCRKLHLPETDIVEVFRRMVFNILANNTDDHTKNFSFVMNKKGVWRLSPAYDITYIFDNGGFLPDQHHSIYIRAKKHNISKEDIVSFAKDNGIRRAETIISEVVEALKNFRTVAAKYGVHEQWIGRVEITILNHLKRWGEVEEDAILEFTKNGHKIRNVCMEQAYKGNFHLLAEIDGEERKFVISKNKEEFSFIQAKGIINLSPDYLKALVEKYFFYTTKVSNFRV